MISIILPVFNERENLAPLLEELAVALAERPYEVVAVDDGSTDGSDEVLRALSRRHDALRLVSFAANAGQSAAVAAGIEAAQGDLIVTMDADGQNDPADLGILLDAIAEEPGVSAAVGYRTGRVDSRWKLIQSRIANAVRDWITGDSVRDTGCSLKVFRRSAFAAVPRFDGMHRFLPTLIRQAGGQVVELPVSHRPRRWGRSKYGMWNRVMRGTRDAFGVRWLRRRALRYSLRESAKDDDA